MKPKSPQRVVVGRPLMIDDFGTVETRQRHGTRLHFPQARHCKEKHKTSKHGLHPVYDQVVRCDLNGHRSNGTRPQGSNGVEKVKSPLRRMVDNNRRVEDSTAGRRIVYFQFNE